MRKYFFLPECVSFALEGVGVPVESYEEEEAGYPQEGVGEVDSAASLEDLVPA